MSNGPPCLECGKTKTIVTTPEADALCFTPRCKLERCRSCHGYLRPFIKRFVPNARMCSCRGAGDTVGGFFDAMADIMGGKWPR